MPTPRSAGRERGQMLALFALSLVAVLGTIGLILDGGDTFLQRRNQQNVADAAAMAGGYASVNGSNATDRARAVATANGYTNAVGGTTVAVSTSSGSITVTITRPHVNAFARVLGFVSWNVTTTATVIAGVPNGAFGAMPLIFNQKAFQDPLNRVPGSPAAFGEPGSGTQDIPQNTTTFNWTVYCIASGNTCNADSTTVDNLILQKGGSVTVYLNDGIAPLNAGSHATLFSDLALDIGGAYPVGIVNDTGNLVGWAWFHLTGSVGGSTKQVSGWFDPDVNAPPLTISPTGGGTGSTAYGTYVVKLTN